jgi:predicted acetyltransferase
MSLEILPALLSEKPELWAMYRHYAIELAPMANIVIVNDEIPAPDFDDFWQQPKHWPFWAVVDGKRAGFALIRFVDEMNAMQMAQFYILPEYRRGNIGLKFARDVIARHPGPWRIRQMAANTRAVAFWRRVAEIYRYTEESFDLRGVPRVEQTVSVS